MTRGRERRPAWVGAATFLALALAWYALTTLTHTIGPGRFPSPGEAWDALRQITIAGYADARLAEHVLHSVKLVLLGFVAATLVGVPLGLAMGASRSFETFVNRRSCWYGRSRLSRGFRSRSSGSVWAMRRRC